MPRPHHGRGIYFWVARRHARRPVSPARSSFTSLRSDKTQDAGRRGRIRRAGAGGSRAGDGNRLAGPATGQSRMSQLEQDVSDDDAFSRGLRPEEDPWSSLAVADDEDDDSTDDDAIPLPVSCSVEADGDDEPEP